MMLADAVKYNIRLSFPNKERTDITCNQIVEGSAKFTESLCSQDSLKFGLCESPVFECETVGVGNITGCKIELTYEVICDANTSGAEFRTDLQKFVFPIKKGVFVVASSERQADMQHRKIVAYGGASATSWELSDYEKSKAMYLFVDMASTYNIRSMTVDLSKIIQTKFDCEIKEELPFGYGGGVSNIYTTENYRITFSAKSASIDVSSIIGKDLIVKAEYNSISSITDAWAKAAEMSKPYIDEMDAKFLEQVKNLYIEKELRPHIYNTSYYPKSGEYVYFNQLPDDRVFQYIIPYAINIKVAYKSGSVLIENEVPIIDIDSVKYYEGESNLIPRPFVVNKVNLNDYFNYDFEKELMNIAELSGKIAKVERDNKLYLIDVKKAFYLKPSDELLPDEQLKPLGVGGGSINKNMYSSLWYEEEYAKPYGRVYCEYTNKSGTQSVRNIYINGFNSDSDSSKYLMYSLTSNEIIQNNQYSQEEITAIMEVVAEAIKGVSYVPLKLKCVSVPFVECGDTLEVLTQNNDSITTIVLKRTLSGESYITDEFTSV